VTSTTGQLTSSAGITTFRRALRLACGGRFAQSFHWMERELVAANIFRTVDDAVAQVFSASDSAPHATRAASW